MVITTSPNIFIGLTISILTLQLNNIKYFHNKISEKLKNNIFAIVLYFIMKIKGIGDGAMNFENKIAISTGTASGIAYYLRKLGKASKNH